MEQLILPISEHMQAVGNRLRLLIKSLGIKQVEAAAVMEVTKNHLGNWIRGVAYPRHYELYRFCRRYGVTADYILLGDPSNLPQRVWEKLVLLEAAQAAQQAAGLQAGESD